MKTIVPITLQDCSWGEFERDGKTYKVEGECDTSRCKAVCCQIMNWRGRVGERCQYLQADLKCEFHAADVHCKPVSCLIWPTKPVDIEKTNEIAARLGFKERCHLKVVEIGND